MRLPRAGSHLECGELLPPDPLTPLENRPSDIVRRAADGTLAHDNGFFGLLDAPEPVAFPHGSDGPLVAGAAHVGCGEAGEGGRRRSRGVRMKSGLANSAKLFWMGDPPSNRSYSLWPTGTPSRKLGPVR
jgi:hypothetical protein